MNIKFLFKNIFKKWYFWLIFSAFLLWSMSHQEYPLVFAQVIGILIADTSLTFVIASPIYIFGSNKNE